MTAVCVLAWLLVALVPGAALLLAARPTASPAVVLAASPLVSLGLVHSWALVLDAVGAPVEVATVVPVVVLMPLAVAAVVLRRRGALLAGRVRLGRPEAWIVLGVCVVAVLVWWDVTHGLSLVPPNEDGTHHGLYATRILELRTVDPSRVVVGDVLTDDPSVAYYPLALHTAAALVSSMSGAPVAVSLDVALVVGAAVLLPVGMALLARRLFPAWRWAAPAAAALSIAFPAFPYYPSYWGGLPLVIGMALVGPLLVLLLDVLDDARPLLVVAVSGVVTGAAFVGLFGLHSSEVVTVLAFAAVLLATDLARRRSWPVARVLLVHGGVAAVVLAAYLAPQLAVLDSTTQLRADVAQMPQVPLLAQIGNAVTVFFGVSPTINGDQQAFLGHPSALSDAVANAGLLVLLALLVVGLVVTVRARVRPEWALCGLGVVVLTVWSGIHAPGGEALTVPWYSRWDRVVLNEIWFVATYAAVGAAVVGAWLVRRRTAVAAAGVTMALAVLPALPQLQRSHATATFGFDSASLADPRARAAFEYLREHVRPGERVLNELTDGSGWMYALDGVTPVFASAEQAMSGWGERHYLREHAAHVDDDARAKTAADQWDVQWLYLGPSLMPFRLPLLDRQAILASPAWRVVFDDGGALVLRRVG